MILAILVKDWLKAFFSLNRLSRLNIGLHFAKCRYSKNTMTPFQNLKELFLPMQSIAQWKGESLKWLYQMKSNVKRHVLTKYCTSSYQFEERRPWNLIFRSPIFPKEHLQFVNLTTSQLKLRRRFWLALGKQQLTSKAESVFVKFSVMMAF